MEQKSIKWKGETTFTQFSSKIMMNPGLNSSDGNNKNIFLPNPLKIQRKEIANINLNDNCFSKTSLKIKDFEIPGGVLTNSKTYQNNGIKNTIEINNENDSCHYLPENCMAAQITPIQKALNRVRKGRILNKDKGYNGYCSSSEQYLNSRSKAFDQNNYHYTRTGNSLVGSGTNLSTQNLYSPNGINRYNKFVFPNNVKFQYIWIDNNFEYYDVPLNGGNSYYLEDVNNILIETMIKNGHYMIKKNTKYKEFLLNISYNNWFNKVELQFFIYNTTLYPPDDFIPKWKHENDNIDFNMFNGKIPQIILDDDTIIQNAFGFNSGIYPNINNGNDIFILGDYISGLKPTYNSIYYKPNNVKFANQGSVSSGDLTTRIKYDTINKYGVLLKSSNNPTKDVMAYGVNQYGYTDKYIKGFPSNKNSLKDCVPNCPTEIKTYVDVIGYPYSSIIYVVNNEPVIKALNVNTKTYFYSNTTDFLTLPYIDTNSDNNVLLVLKPVTVNILIVDGGNCSTNDLGGKGGSVGIFKNFNLNIGIYKITVGKGSTRQNTVGSVSIYNEKFYQIMKSSINSIKLNTIEQINLTTDYAMINQGESEYNDITYFTGGMSDLNGVIPQQYPDGIQCDFLPPMTDLGSVSVSNPYFGGGGGNAFSYELNGNSGGGCGGNYYYYLGGGGGGNSINGYFSDTGGGGPNGRGGGINSGNSINNSSGGGGSGGAGTIPDNTAGGNNGENGSSGNGGGNGGGGGGGFSATHISNFYKETINGSGGGGNAGAGSGGYYLNVQNINYDYKGGNGDENGGRGSDGIHNDVFGYFGGGSGGNGLGGGGGGGGGDGGSGIIIVQIIK